MAEKAKTANQVKHIPKDAQVIVSIMKDMGITDYEPKVINQLLELTYRYVACILDDSKVYANHSKKKFIDIDDVRLAVTMQLQNSFSNPPPREVLIDIAKEKNKVPLPFVKPSYGLRLPPDRYCLNGANYKLKSPSKKIGKMGVGNASGGLGRMPTFSIVKRPGNLGTMSRTQTISMPKPALKVSTSNFNTSKSQPQITQMKPKMSSLTDLGQILTPVIKTESEESNKRKREDDDYDVP